MADERGEFFRETFLRSMSYYHHRKLSVCVRILQRRCNIFSIELNTRCARFSFVDNHQIVKNKRIFLRHSNSLIIMFSVFIAGELIIRNRTICKFRLIFTVGFKLTNWTCDQIRHAGIVVNSIVFVVLHYHYYGQ